MKTHIEYYLEWKDKKGNDIYLRQPKDNDWMEVTWSEAYNQSAKIAQHLQNMGIEKGSNIAILSKNCMHWIMADLAIIMGGYVSTPFFPNLSKEEFRDLIKRSEAKAIFIGKLDAPVWELLKDEIPNDVKVIAFPHYEGNANIETGEKWEEIMSKTSPIENPHIPKLDDLWTILFTSGTTGPPKGVMLSYRSPATLMDMEIKQNQIGIFNSKEYRFFSYLPLNHIAERMIIEIASLLTGGTVSFAESLDTFAINLQSVQPTSFMSVPRIYTKFQLAVIDKIGENKLNFLLKIPIVKNIIKEKIKKGFGLSKADVILTGAAPTPQSLKNWYSKLGIDLREIYGMTENAGGCCVMPQNFSIPNFVGKALPEVELKIDEDGEVMMKAPWMMMGYFKNLEKTNEVLQNGWLKTGDCGFLSEDGYLKITGRATDTFKTSKGKFIVPGPIEWKLSENTNVEQVCVTGLGLNQPIALVNLSEMGKNESKEDLEKNLKQTIEKVNNDRPSYQHISKVVVINEEWNVDMGLLTPTMKIKRRKVNERYNSLFQGWEKKEDIILYHGK